jgi:PKD repeat protein
VENDAPAGNSDRHNCLLIDGVGNLMDNKRGYEVPELGTADCTGAVDSDYGHIIEAVMGGIYQPVTNYSRYMFVIRNKMYVITVDELDSGHTSDFRVFPGINTAKQSSDLYTNSMTRFELIYPSSGYTSSEASHPIDITTSSNKIMFLTHPNPSGVSFSKSYPGNLAKLTVGSDTIIYNPTGGSYSESGISGNAKLFAQRTGGAIICKATSATGSQYGLSCSAATSMSVSGRKAQIFVYGTGNYTVTVTSPYGTDAFANVPAGQTVSKVLTGLGTAPPVADFIAVPTEGWNTYVAPEFVSFSTGWITDYLWEFGDGEWSTDLAPHHKYVSAGLYSIKLTVAGPGGTSSMTKEKYITIKDFGNYSWPDYVLTQPDFAVFTSALQSIEASQTQFYTEKPEWCHNGSWTPWCDVVTSLCGHGGGGRILFGFSNTTVYGNWDGRIDPIKTWGDSNNKYDFIGDNLIIDGQDKNVGFYYNGTLDCGQAENQQAFRLHGVDNIVKNIRWERFPDGIHMRHGMRMLMEGVNNSVVCEDTMTANGVSGSCVACTSRNCTFGASTDKTFMNSTAEGWRGLAPSLLVISGMHSTDGTQPIRVGSDDKSSMTIVRNSTFLGNSAGPRFGGNQSTIIFENNYSSTQKGNDGGLRIGEQVRCIVRHNTLENCGGYGIWCHGTGAYARIENNIITGNDKDGVEALGESSYDLGGGSVEVFWTKNPASMYGIGPGGTAAPSCGRNTITGNGLYDLRNGIDGTPQPEVKAENNFWDHSTVSEVLSSDVSGNVDVDPLGVNIN